jgi:hypothetical protein
MTLNLHALSDDKDNDRLPIALKIPSNSCKAWLSVAIVVVAYISLIKARTPHRDTIANLSRA